MSKLQDRMIAGFTAGERDYTRRELDMFFSTLPSMAEGSMEARVSLHGSVDDRVGSIGFF